MSSIIRLLACGALAASACTSDDGTALAVTGPGHSFEVTVDTVELEGDDVTYHVTAGGDAYTVEASLATPDRRTVRHASGELALTLVERDGRPQACRDAACSGGPVSMDLAIDDGLRPARYLLGMDLPHLAPALGESRRSGVRFEAPQVNGVSTLRGFDVILTCYETGGYTDGTCTAVTLSCFGGGLLAGCFAETCGNNESGTITTYSSTCFFY